MLTGIVLAGGKASRIGQNKLLMPIDGIPIIHHVIGTMRRHVNRVVVVVGHYANELADALANEEVHVIVNDKYAQGMFTSVLAGLTHADGDVVIVPGDTPFIQSSTYRLLLQAKGGIRVPAYKDRRGHPIFISEPYAAMLKEEPADSNLKAFRNRHAFTTVPVDDEGILLDFDTHDDFLYHATKERD